MTSYDQSRPDMTFAPSSWSSSSSVMDVVASYRRAQTFMTAQNLQSVPSPDSCSDEGDDVENQRRPSSIPDLSDDCDESPTPVFEDYAAAFAWDEPETTTQRPPNPVRKLSLASLPREPSSSSVETVRQSRPNSNANASPRPEMSERSALLHKQSTVSVASYVSPQRTAQSPPIAQQGQSPRIKRRLSRADSEKPPRSGQSTFGQTLFNSIAILLGFGMLSEPLAFSQAGWIGGMALLILFGSVNCYTAKILARIMMEDRRIRTYADIGKKAFGPRSTFMTDAVFCMELFSVAVVLVTLFGDTLNTIYPTYSSNSYKIMGIFILLPTVFMPLSVLSYTSLLGIFSTLMIIAVVLIDGFSKTGAPGSLWHPLPTNFVFHDFGKLGVAFGLFMAGFSGHAVLPSLAQDMTDPRRFDSMINRAFIIATIVYAVIGGSGYLMFGNSVSDEISRDLLLTPGYNAFINKAMMYSLVVLPLTKFALTIRPVNVAIEIMLGIDTSPSDPHSPPSTTSSSPPPSHPRKYAPLLYTLSRSLTRILLTLLPVAVSIFFPGFSAMVAFVGSCSAFLLCVIGPISAKIALNGGRCTMGDVALLVMGVVLGVWGTVAAFSASA